MSDLVGNPEDRVSRVVDQPHFLNSALNCNLCVKNNLLPSLVEQTSLYW